MLGDYVNAQQTCTYDVQSVREQLIDFGIDNPTDEEILDAINEWAGEEFGTGDYALYDEEGNEL